MSWKSFVTAGLLCALATPVFANPTLRIVSGGLNSNGDWVWNVSIEEGFTGDDNLSPVAAELGFDANSNVVSATKATEFDGPNTDNPGNVIFGWETLTNLGGTGTCDSTSPGNCPVGVQIGTAADADKVFAAVGSKTDGGFSGQQDFLTIVTSGPTNTALTGSVDVSGAYGTNEGRIAELAMVSINGGAAEMRGLNFNGYTGQASRTVKNGDINLDGFTDNADVGIFSSQYQPGAAKAGNWTIGDFNRDGFVDNADVGIFSSSYAPGVAGGSTNNLTDTGVAVLPSGWALAGAGGGSGGSAVPEPASMAMVGLGMLAGLGLLRRHRS